MNLAIGIMDMTKGITPNIFPSCLGKPRWVVFLNWLVGKSTLSTDVACGTGVS